MREIAEFVFDSEFSTIVYDYNAVVAGVEARNVVAVEVAKTLNPALNETLSDTLNAFKTVLVSSFDLEPKHHVDNQPDTTPAVPLPDCWVKELAG